MHIPDHIQNLIRKYEQGALSDAEKKELDNWYHSFDDQQTTVTDLPQGSVEELSERIGNRLQESLAAAEENLEPVSRKNNGKWRRPAAAAAFVLIFLSGAVYYFIRPDQTVVEQPLVLSAPVPAGDVAPGGNKAMLTFDDGSVIILDSANNGILGEQGEVKVKKLDNGLVAYQTNNGGPAIEEKVFYNTISTPRGGEYQVTLSDGTKVWLNAASSIRFPTAFRGSERQVQITGEVYFEVARNEAKPFKVSAGKSAIEVLGTHFNVNAYDDEVQVRTSLLEGAVKVFAADESEQQVKVLRPGQQARMTKSGRINVVNNIDTEEVMAWKNGLFVFKSTDLRSIMRQIARWYDVDIEYKGNVGMQFTGQITRNNNVSKVLEMLELTEEVKFKVEGKQVIVSR